MVRTLSSIVTDILYVLLIVSVARLLEFDLVDAGSTTQFDVLSFGAVGDGVADDTQAFTKAWNAACWGATGPATIVVPGGKTYFVKPTIFYGQCKSGKVNIQIDGKLVAPDDPSWWKGIQQSLWLQFQSVSGLAIFGNGEINGRGQKWWKQSCKKNPKSGCTFEAPNGMRFVNCSDISVSNLHFVDSALVHMLILDSQRVGIYNLKLTAPGDSPNTDGIHIHNSRQVKIDNSVIGTGDDCISIGDYIHDISINRIVCGPGHGISIGSLVYDGTTASVEEVHVRNSQFYGTTNGARIKTWQGGKGFVTGVSFEQCKFTNVANPIVIDQYYCDIPGKCKSDPNGVQISNVTYTNLQGTSKTPVAISLNCSQSVPCKSLHFDNVNLVAARKKTHTKANCLNAYGSTTGFIQPAISCLG